MTESDAIKILDAETREDYLHQYDHKDRSDIFERAARVAVDILAEIKIYRAIGTVEELRELKEKATAKAPYLFGDGYFNGVPVYDEYNCPNCDESYEVDFDHYDYCPKCGQKLDWSEEKEQE